jgi:hypothetical protein
VGRGGCGGSAGVAGPGRCVVSGPGPGREGPGRRGPRWSRRRVVDELRRLDQAGASTGWGDLLEAGHSGLVAAAGAYAGGLTKARKLAGVAPPARRLPVPRWNQPRIVGAIRDRVGKGQGLASSTVPPQMLAAGRWHFGSWDAALAAAGVDAAAIRLQRAPYTREEIIERIRGLAQAGTAVRPGTLKRVVKLDTVRKLFGSVAGAVRAAGIAGPPVHGNQKWSRQRVIEELKARARRGEVGLTRGLERAAQLYFGGAHAARAAAGLPAMVRAPWTQRALIAELRGRARRGDSGRTLWGVCRRLFGSVAAARRAAGVPATQRGAGMVAWDEAALLAELRRRSGAGQQLGRGLIAGLRRAFGSLAEARARAGLAIAGAALRARGRASRGARKLPATATWTTGRIRRALREPSFDRADPGFVAACIAQFGSVTAADAAARPRRRAWTKATVVSELRARADRGLRGVGPLLRAPSLRLFGSAEAALAAAGRGTRRPRSRSAASARPGANVAGARRG